MGGLMAAMDTMMQSMEGMEATGGPDADVLLKIPHHRSAIHMARAELERGGDEATRAMAQQITDSPEAEIAEVEAMLAEMGRSME
jgi:uncharacterized protein (DUF305 family)